MALYNLKDESQIVDFATAVKTGLGRQQGLFFPRHIDALDDIERLLDGNAHERNFAILRPFVSDSIDDETLRQIIAKTFAFPAKLATVDERLFCLELYQGPTLAFKDFGANFMANCLQSFADEKPITILTATSGDTGAAVAHAFHGLKNIRVVILFPKGKISSLQQKMFTTLGDNIHTIAVDGSFDDCQALVKQSFDEQQLVEKVGLNSANSINISRLLAQVCYYFDGFAQLPKAQPNATVVAVPCGNFGNLCAAIIAKVLGLPIKRFIAATNVNDTVPRFLQTGEWSPKATIATLSNAMDVSQPNNWPRIQYLIDSGQFDAALLSAIAVDEEQTQLTLRSLYQRHYLSEPHAAVACHALEKSLTEYETGLFLGTAHPAKFQSSVEEILGISIPLPQPLLDCVDKRDRAIDMPADFKRLSEKLYQLAETGSIG